MIRFLPRSLQNLMRGATLLVAPLFTFFPAVALAQRQLENLDRGLIVLPTPEGNFVSWRLLGTDAAEITFNVHRGNANDVWRKINDQPLTDVTWFLDPDEDHEAVAYHTALSEKPFLSQTGLL